MNFVFWLLVLIALAIVYFLGAFIFPKIGSLAVRAYENFKKAVSSDMQPKNQGSNKTKENSLNEE